MRASTLSRAVLLLLLLAAAAFTVSTYQTFDHTYDEPAHLAAGMQLLDQGRYDYELTHGPLARLAVAVGPYLDGSRSHGEANINDEGRAILYCCGEYERTLTLARLGNLPFLVVLIVVTWQWGRRLGGEIAGATAAFCIATLPPVLGNAAIATTDLAAAAMATLALYALTLWTQRPTLAAGWLLGAACGFAVASKLSAVPFLVAAAAGLGLSILLLQPRSLGQIVAQPRWRGYAIVLLAALVALWLAYGMRLAPLGQLDARIDPLVDRIAGRAGRLHDTFRFLVDAIPIPIYLVKLPLGVRWAGHLNDRGHLTFLLGQTSMRGWWYYYPVNLAVRTPIPLLLMGLAGLGLLAVRGWRTKSWQTVFPLSAFVSILLFCMLFVRFNLGLRHVFILYPPLAVAAGCVIATLFNKSGRAFQADTAANAPQASAPGDGEARQPIALKVLAAVALCWLAVTPLMAMPDQMTYFNAFAGRKPEKILLVADLDWGQDLKRLKRVLSERHVGKVYLLYEGSADLSREGLPTFELLQENVPVSGWVAVSLLKKARGGDDFAWLDRYQPLQRVGRSIDLYFIPAPAAPAP